MKLLKDIAGRVFAAWALLLFVASLLLFFIYFLLFCYFLKDPARNRRFIGASRIWMGIYLPLIGCPLRIRGKEHFKPGEVYIVVCNHNSLMDVPVSSPAIPGGNKTIAKSEMARIPLFGTIYRTGSVLVSRKSESSRRESFEKMKDVLAMGLHMCIYPEGTRNRTDQPLKSFHDGAFRLSMSTGRAIIPAVIYQTASVLPAGRTFYLMPHPLQIRFLSPVSPEKFSGSESMKTTVFEQMKNAFLEGPR